MPKLASRRPRASKPFANFADKLQAQIEHRGERANSEGELRGWVREIALAESRSWPFAWRLLVQHPDPPQATALAVAETGAELDRALAAHIAALEARDRIAPPAPTIEESRHAFRAKLAELRSLVQVEAGFASAVHWGRSPANGRTPQPTRTRVASEMISFFDAALAARLGGCSAEHVAEALERAGSTVRRESGPGRSVRHFLETSS